MKKLVRALCAALLVIGICSSPAALAETPYYIDVLGREVIVPDGWTIETDAEGYLNFVHLASLDSIVICDTGMSAEGLNQPSVVAGAAFILACSAVESSGGSDPTAEAFFDFTSDDSRIVGGSVLYEQDGKQKIMWSYTFAAGSDTWGRCWFQYPLDGSLDISWFTSAVEAVFPELEKVHVDIPGNVAAEDEEAESPAIAEDAANEDIGEDTYEGEQAENPAVGRDADNKDVSEGTYDGEYDANGLRSGYGTWTYHNFLYAGHWENDLPNGEGALYYHLGSEDNGNKIINKYVLEGIWVDGFAEGQVEDTIIQSSGDPIIFRYDVINGCMTSDELIPATDGHTKIVGKIGLLVGCVPPWGDIETDASAPAPSPTFDYDHDILPAPDYHLATLGDSRVAFQLRYQVVDGNAVITGYQASGSATINDLTIPAEVDGYPVTAIGESAFEECWRVLDWVILPDGVISIGERAFRGCASIKAFFIPDSVTSIGNEAFAECERLMEATVPSSVTSLGSDVFRNTPLAGMAVGGHAPSGDANESMRLTYEVVDDNAVITGYEVDNRDIFYSLVIPSELDGYPVTAIGDHAFMKCYDLWRVIIPDGVVSIGEGAFRECPNMRSVIIPKSVTTIGIEVFADCWGLETISIPDSVASAGDETGGVYEGEYDENGKRSGFGVWAYYNYLYVGQWENDLPNGEGTL